VRKFFNDIFIIISNDLQVGTDSKSANRRLKQALKRGVTLGTLEHIEVIIFFT
jgi:hypothetical protein